MISISPKTACVVALSILIELTVKLCAAILNYEAIGELDFKILENLHSALSCFTICSSLDFTFRGRRSWSASVFMGSCCRQTVHGVPWGWILLTCSLTITTDLKKADKSPSSKPIKTKQALFNSSFPMSFCDRKKKIVKKTSKDVIQSCYVILLLQQQRSLTPERVSQCLRATSDR